MAVKSWHGGCSYRVRQINRIRIKMAHTKKIAAVAGFFATLITGSAHAAGAWDNSASYNSAYAMASGQENATASPSLRDANGNLTIVNGQFTTGTMQMSGVSSRGSQSGVGGNGTQQVGTATAIANSLNVITSGSNNTVVVNATQTNTGNVTSSVSLNGQ